MSEIKPIKLKVPAQGQKITINDGKLTVPDQPDHSVHRRRRHRARHLARQRAGARRGGGQGLRRQTQNPLDGGLRRREVEQTLQHLAARRDRRGLPRIPGLDQGPADHADRRRHPLAERGAAPDARPVRLPAPGALVQGRALPGQGAREGRHGDLPREHRGHLRRHRVRGRHRRQPEVPGPVQGELSQGVRQDPLSRTPPASASSRSPRKAPSACSARRSSTPSPTSARASRSCTRATS